MKKILLLTLLTVLALPLYAQAGTALTASTTVAVSETIAPFITIVAPATLTLNGSGVVPATVNVSWNIPGPATSTIDVVGYFSSTNALTSGANNITASQVSVGINGSTANTVTGAPIQGIGVAGATILLTQNTAVVPGPGQRSADTYNFSLSGIGSQQAGTYTGTFNIAAIAF